jgi:hypothetical protein
MSKGRLLALRVAWAKKRELGEFMKGIGGVMTILALAFTLGIFGGGSEQILYAGAGSPPPSPPPPSMTAGQTIVGHVIECDRERCLIRTEFEEKVEALIDSTTFLPEGLEPGDEVEAVVLASGVARSIVLLPGGREADR